VPSRPPAQSPLGVGTSEAGWSAWRAMVWVQGQRCPPLASSTLPLQHSVRVARAKGPPLPGALVLHVLPPPTRLGSPAASAGPPPLDEGQGFALPPLHPWRRGVPPLTLPTSLLAHGGLLSIAGWVPP